MTDFFSRIVSRNVQQANVLLPRPVSYFEPGARRSTSAAAGDSLYLKDEERVTANAETPSAHGIDEHSAAIELPTAHPSVDGIRRITDQRKPSLDGHAEKGDLAIASPTSQDPTPHHVSAQNHVETGLSVRPRVMLQREHSQQNAPPQAPERFHLIRRDASTPRVNVTIGRIEVKATQEPAQVHQRRRDPVPTHLSLEDYLKKKRNGNE